MLTNWVKALGLVGVAGLLAGCGGGPPMEEASAPEPPPAAAEPAPPHVGSWDLASVELRDASGAALPAPDGPALGQPGAVGRLIFDGAGHFGLAIMEQGRPKYAEPTEEQAVADLYGYTAMFGIYTLDDGGNALDVRFVGSRDPRADGHDLLDAAERGGRSTDPGAARARQRRDADHGLAAHAGSGGADADARARDRLLAARAERRRHDRQSADPAGVSSSTRRRGR